MDYSRKISERLWNIPDKGEMESQREKTFIDVIHLIWLCRLILRFLIHIPDRKRSLKSW